MFAGLYLIGAGMFFAGKLCYEVFRDEDSKEDNPLLRSMSFIMFIGLLSFPLITIAYGIKLIINN